MALLLDVQLPSHVVASYHRVTTLAFNANTGEVSATVAGYLDEAARHAGAEPVRMQTVTFRTTTDPTRAAVYEVLKADTFSGAADG